MEFVNNVVKEEEVKVNDIIYNLMNFKDKTLPNLESIINNNYKKLIDLNENNIKVLKLELSNSLEKLENKLDNEVNENINNLNNNFEKKIESFFIINFNINYFII
jgi:hypothetical protein